MTEEAALYVAHFLIVVAIASIPVWPLSWLRVGVYIPAALSLLWLLCNGCPITHAKPKIETNFVHDLLSSFISITENQSNHLVAAHLILTTLVAAARLWKIKK